MWRGHPANISFKPAVRNIQFYQIANPKGTASNGSHVCPPITGMGVCVCCNTNFHQVATSAIKQTVLNQLLHNMVKFVSAIDYYLLKEQKSFTPV